MKVRGLSRLVENVNNQRCLELAVGEVSKSIKPVEGLYILDNKESLGTPRSSDALIQSPHLKICKIHF